MKHPMKVLIAHDGSESAYAAVGDLSRAGCPKGTEILVLCVAETWLPPDPAAPMDPVAARTFPGLQAGRDSAKAVLADAKQAALRAGDMTARLHPSWKVRTEARAGSPGWTIFERAASWKPHLIVVGSRGRSAWDRWTLGSVSHQVLLTTKSSVRIARPRAPGDERPPRILIGWDGSKGADLALQAAAGRPWPEGTEFCVAAVLQEPLPARSGRDVRDSWTRKVEKAAERLKAPGRVVRTLVREGDPKRVLMEEAADWKADAVFLGARGLTPWKSLLLGSVSAAVAARAHCTVEVVRPGFWAGRKEGAAPPSKAKALKV